MAVICHSEITVLISEGQAYGVVSSAYVSNVRIFIFVEHFRNRPKIEPCGTPYSILNLLLKHPFVLVR